ncbi:MAG: hypothetical protein M1830_004516 [Pleopsidium flavum]|nr:MAG: hypothetical protein M1830_009191 [Pleopsidium flavum]KAI9877211.1 MAG: hypothetical protein M1830_004516 [Pleopsidium flavum]
MLALVLLLFGFGPLVFAKSVHYDWDITWVTAALDGFSRPVIGINGKWPCPQVDVDVGDRMVVHMYNGLGNQSTSLHWHGIHQNGSTDMDGASGTGQCPIAPGQSFTYDFVVDQAGTYWYHSHNLGQFPDGLWGPLIVHDPNPPFHFDEEITITLSDWYHEQMPDLIHTYQSYAGEAADGTPAPTGGALMNSGKNITIPVKLNKTYFIRVICPGSFPGHAWFFDQHPMITVEIDGVYVEPAAVNRGAEQVRIAPGQRQGVLITTKIDTSQNYAIFDTMDINMLFFNKGQFLPAGYNTNVTGWLVYNESAPLPAPPVLHSLDNSNFFDDLDYVPLDHAPVLQPVDHQIVMETNSANISGISRFTINNSTYIGQKVPSLYTALTMGGNYSSNPVVYGQVNPYVIKHNEIVEIVINNYNSNLHPWHLHGHQFQVLERSPPNGGAFSGTYSNHSSTPVRRDTVMLQPKGYAVIRFRADNPDKFFLPAEWEMLRASPEKLADSGLKRPRDHLAACEIYPMDIAGNAAGNTRDPLDLQGSFTVASANDYGYVVHLSGTEFVLRTLLVPFIPLQLQSGPADADFFVPSPFVYTNLLVLKRLAGGEAVNTRSHPLIRDEIWL